MIMRTLHRTDKAAFPALFAAAALIAAFAAPAWAATTPAPAPVDNKIGCATTGKGGTALFICKCNIPAGNSCDSYCKARNTTCIEGSYPECQTQCKTDKSVATGVAEPMRTRGLDNPLAAATIPALIGKVIRMFTGVVGSLALLMFVYGGLLWMTSRGNAEQIDKGKRIFVWSSIGLVIIFSAYLILRVLFQTIGATS